MKTLDAGASRHGIAVHEPVFQFIKNKIALKYYFAVLMLLAATVFWGVGNVAQKVALSDISPFALLTLRSIIACLVLFPFAIRECRQKSIGIAEIVKNLGILLVTSLSFTAGLACQTYGGNATSATNLGFIINLCVLITPMMLYFIYGERISKLTLLSCVICFIGAGLLTGLHLQKPNSGDALCLLGAVFYAGWIISLDRTLKVLDAPILITVLQFVPLCLLGLASAFTTNTLFNMNYAKVWPALLFVSLLSTCISFLIAAYAQRLVKPVVAGIIYSFEALFGGIAAYFVLGEQLSISAMIGGGLMFFSILVCQYKANALENNRGHQIPHSPDELQSWVGRLNV